MCAGLPSFDPACIEAQTVCRFASLKYTVNDGNNPHVSPSGKLPLLQIGDTCHAGDDALRRIASELVDVDGFLTLEQRSQALALKTLIKDRFNNCLVKTYACMLQCVRIIKSSCVLLNVFAFVCMQKNYLKAVQLVAGE
jgi:hypothetical protein